MMTLERAANVEALVGTDDNVSDEKLNIEENGSINKEINPFDDRESGNILKEAVDSMDVENVKNISLCSEWTAEPCKCSCCNWEPSC